MENHDSHHSSPPAPDTQARDVHLYVLIAAAALLFLGLASILLSQQYGATHSPGVDHHDPSAGPPRPLPEVLDIAKAMKLVTVVVETTAASEASSETWRGDARAEIIAPITVMYGVDLSDLSLESLTFNKLTNTYHLTIPRPERIAVEIDASEATEMVEVTGTRTRGRAGNYLLSQAHKKLYDTAFAQGLPRETQEQIRTMTREQVATMVRLFLQDSDAKIDVTINEEKPGLLGSFFGK